MQCVGALEVRGQLARILASSKFVNAPRLSHFLRFVVEKSLAGEVNQIKAYTIALEVFEREKDFQSSLDPIVRIQAGNLSRSLAAYYEAAGKNDPIRIDIPKGFYTPVFRDNAIAGTNLYPEAQELKGSGNPVISVMPFINRSGEASQNYFAEGFGEELSTRLSQFRDLGVIAYYSTLQLKDQRLSVQDVARKLGAHFVISGSVSKDADVLRLKVALSETKHSKQLWAKRFHREMTSGNLIEIEEEIIHNIIVQITGEYGVISHELWKVSRGKKAADLSTYEAILRHHHANIVVTKETHSMAREAWSRRSKWIRIMPWPGPCWLKFTVILFPPIFPNWTTRWTGHSPA